MNPNPPLQTGAREYGELSTLYDAGWYDNQVKESLNSARIFIEYIWKYIQPDSVLDVGCGRGAWLKAWHEKGSKQLFGFDGVWNRQENMIDPSIEFKAIDLNQPFSVRGKVGLAMTLEVAEHLKPRSAKSFVKSLTDASDLVLFGAAYSYQGGTHHINEQPHTYWANLFRDDGFVPFDLLRPVFWADDRVCFWYRQNTFLYAKKGSASYEILSQGLTEMAGTGFMDCIHPTLYHSKVGSNIGFRMHLVDLIPSFVRAVKRRLKRVIK